jgi:molybdenum cofactor synthesis domain-containing protein
MIRARVITCSDAASRGEREDRSGPAVHTLLREHSFEVDGVVIVPDEVDRIGAAIIEAIEAGTRLVVTTGGTGIAPCDVTPEATMQVCERVVPGFGERMRSASIEKAPAAILSRAQAAIRGTALVVNLPGSVSGAVECLNAVLPVIPHALALLDGRTDH